MGKTFDAILPLLSGYLFGSGVALTELKYNWIEANDNFIFLLIFMGITLFLIYFPKIGDSIKAKSRGE